MDMTAYWLNFKKKRAGEDKYYYFYPYTRCEIDDTPTFIIGGKQYVRIEVSEAEREILRERMAKNITTSAVRTTRGGRQIFRGFRTRTGKRSIFGLTARRTKERTTSRTISARRWIAKRLSVVCRLSNGAFIARTERAIRRARSQKWSG